MANYTPMDIYRFVKEEKLDADFMVALTMHKRNFTIAEITDAKFREREDGWHLLAPSFKINVKVEDEDVLAALENEFYVSAFLSRYEEKYNVHFLVHRCPARMKPQFEEEILEEVVRYMMLSTIVSLRLDTPEKVRAYCGK